jgi:hypothetical protein
MSRKLWILGAAVVLAGLGAWWYLWRESGSGLLAQAPYRVLREHEPEAWQRVLAAYERFQADPQARAAFVNVSNEEFSAAATRRLSGASHQSKLALMRDFVANLKLLHARMGDACFRYLYPEVSGGTGTDARACRGSHPQFGRGAGEGRASAGCRTEARAHH